MAVAVLIGWATGPAFAQSGGGYVIKKSTIDSGGHSNLTDMGGTYKLGGTVGQHDTGDLAGGNYVLSGGFWSPIASAAANPALAVPSGQLSCRKNRYLSFQTNNPGAEVAFEVQRTSSPVMTGYAGPPDANGVSGVYPAPHFRIDWSAVLSVGDCEIAPAHNYEVRVIPGPSPGGAPTAPLALQTIAQPGIKFFGDTTGGLVAGAWDCPNGVVNANDFQMALQKFLGAATAPHNTMSNVQAVSSTDPGLNTPTNIADVFLIVKAFQGNVYPFVIGNPANCPPNTGAAGQCPL